MSLRLKFVLCLVGIVIVTLGQAAWTYSDNELEALNQKKQLLREQQVAMKEEVDRRAATVAAFGEACRDYTQKVLAPAVEEHVQGKLILPAMSRTFVARGTFEQFRQKKGMEDYSFREASLNPLNRDRNLADAEETNLIKKFRAQPELQEATGIFEKAGRKLSYVARPIKVQSSCLRCHDSPQTAPPELAKKYPGPGGYGWTVGDINSILMVTVPTDDLQQQTAQFEQRSNELTEKQLVSLKWGLFGFAARGLALIALLYLAAELLIFRRLTTALQAVQTGSHASQWQDSSKDELGQLAAVFQRTSVAYQEARAQLRDRAELPAPPPEN